LFYCCGVVLRLIYLDTDSPQATSESAAAATRSSLARELQQLEAQIADNHREVTHPPTNASIRLTCCVCCCACCCVQLITMQQLHESLAPMTWEASSVHISAGSSLSIPIPIPAGVTADVRDLTVLL
jgi:hypothetical protein